jgi:hypothetical protein
METETTGTGKRHLRRRVWVVLAAIVLTIASAGAAGQAMAGDTSGDIAINAGQALGVAGGTVSGASAGRVIVGDDGISFQAPVEVFTGDRFTVNLALVNRSQQPLDLQATMTAPSGFTLDIAAADGATGAVRLGPNSWAFTIDPAESDYEPDLAVTIAVSDVITPGFYNLECVIEPLTFPGGAS